MPLIAELQLQPARLGAKPDRLRSLCSLDAVAGGASIPLLTHYAPGFDSHLVGTLNYDIPSLLARLLAATLGHGASKADILYLGCGTGLFGAAVKPWRNTLVGVDVSAGMLAVAAGKSVCDSLVGADLYDYLRASAADAFQVIVAADVLCYLGDLTELFEQAQGLP